MTIPEISITGESGEGIKRKAGRPKNALDTKPRAPRKVNVAASKKNAEFARLANLNIAKQSRTRRLEREGGRRSIPSSRETGEARSRIDRLREQALREVSGAKLPDETKKYVEREFKEIRDKLAKGQFTATEAENDARDLVQFARLDRRAAAALPVLNPFVPATAAKAAGGAAATPRTGGPRTLPSVPTRPGTAPATGGARNTIPFPSLGSSAKVTSPKNLPSTNSPPRIPPGTPSAVSDESVRLSHADIDGLSLDHLRIALGVRDGKSYPNAKAKFLKARLKQYARGLPAPKKDAHRCLEHDVKDGCKLKMDKVEKNKKSKQKELDELKRSRTMITRTINYVNKL